MSNKLKACNEEYFTGDRWDKHSRSSDYIHSQGLKEAVKRRDAYEAGWDDAHNRTIDLVKTLIYMHYPVDDLPKGDRINQLLQSIEKIQP